MGGSGMSEAERSIEFLKHIRDEVSYLTAYDIPINTAISALEKQIPKQIIGIEANLQNRYCPSCNEWMIFEKVGKVKYCPMCGQALKWEVVE